MPIAQIWTLKSAGGLEQPLAAWGIARAVVTRESQAPDVLRISVPSAKFDDAPLFAFNGIVTLYRYAATDPTTGLPTGSGTKWFVGRCTKTPRMGRPNAEGMDYEFRGPWDDLEHVVYEQNWTAFAGEDEVTAPQSRVNLATDITGALTTTAAQITDALTWATGAGAALQAGALPTGIYVPSEQGTDLTCAEVIKRMLRWQPDVITWFDYTFSPPKLNFGHRAALTALSLAVGGQPAQEIDIVSRDDLLPPVVVLKYSQTNIVNGLESLSLLTEKYPTAAAEQQLRALVLSVDLQGSRSSYLTQDIVAPAIDAANIAWWQLHCPELNDPTIVTDSLTYVADSAAVAVVNDGDTAYANELKDGAIAAWMGKNTSEVYVSANLSYQQTTLDGNGNSVVQQIVARAFRVKVVSTDADTGTFQSIGSSSPADPKPTSLAQNYYTALATLQYEGSFAIVEAEVGTLAVADTGAPYSNRVLNLTGGLTAWATMKAQIYSVTEDLATGKTTLRFGPHKYLSPADMVAQLRATRQRVIPELAERSGGVTSGGPQVLPSKHKEAVAGKAEMQPDLVIANGDKTFTIRLSGVNVGALPAQNLNFIPRVISICAGDGTLQNMIVLATETYT